MNSILKTIRKMVGGIEADQTHFDSDLIVHINSVFSVLTQLGLGPSKGFLISDDTATWDQFIEDAENIELVKSYVYLRVKLLFDPPSSSAVLEAIERSISEFEFRLNVLAEEMSLNSEENQNG